MDLTYAEAPYGSPLDGLIDPVDLPRSIRVLARPNMKTIYPFALDILSSLGHRRDLPGKGRGTSTPTTLATAWSLAHGVESVYIGEAQDLHPSALEEVVDFAARIGASLCLVFGFGQVHTHASLLHRRGVEPIEYLDLPAAIVTPGRSSDGTVPLADKSAVPDHAVPEDDWMTFRAAYHEALGPVAAEECDRLYRLTMTRVAESSPQTPDEVSRVISSVWQSTNCGQQHRIVAVRAAQAAMFRHGWNAKVKFKEIERYIADRYLNPLRPHHYQELSAYSDPWRAAATALHAHHVSTEDMRTLRARSVSADGAVDNLNVDDDDDARLILRAQRWTQLIGSTDPDPPFIDHSIQTIRAGIRVTTAELNLPLIAKWRRADDKRYDGRTGLLMERF